MTTLAENYTWEAELADGTVVTEGGDLTAAVRFSLIPQNMFLIRHDIVGVKMKRRFGRGFVRALGGNGLKEYVHCVVCEGFRVYFRSTDGVVLVTPEDYELYL